MLIAARSKSAHRPAQLATSAFLMYVPLRESRSPREDPMADDRDYTRDENPPQGPSHSFGKNVGAADRERSIATEREGGAPGTTRTPATEPATAPVRGGRSGAFTLMRRMADDMDRLFELGLGR